MADHAGRFGRQTGALAGHRTPAPVLLVVLGIYAILAGLRMLLIKPMPERDDKAHPAWQAPVAFLFGGLTGLISAGGKPFSVPIYNWVMGHHPQRAYAMASVGVAAAAWSALGTQVATGTPLAPVSLGLQASVHADHPDGTGSESLLVAAPEPGRDLDRRVPCWY